MTWLMVFLDGVEFSASGLLLGLEGLGTRWFVALEGAVLEDQGAWAGRGARFHRRASCHARCPGW